MRYISIIGYTSTRVNRNIAACLGLIALSGLVTNYKDILEPYKKLGEALSDKLQVPIYGEFNGTQPENLYKEVQGFLALLRDCLGWVT